MERGNRLGFEGESRKTRGLATVSHISGHSHVPFKAAPKKKRKTVYLPKRRKNANKKRKLEAQKSFLCAQRKIVARNENEHPGPAASMQTVRRSEHKLTFLCPAAMVQKEVVGSQNSWQAAEAEAAAASEEDTGCRVMGGADWAGAARVLSNARIIYEEAEGPFTSLHFISFRFHFASFPFRLTAFFAIRL